MNSTASSCGASPTCQGRILCVQACFLVLEVKSKDEHLGPFLADIQARAGKQVHSFTDRRSTIKAGSESKSNHSAGWQENYKRLLDFPRRNSMMS